MTTFIYPNLNKHHAKECTEQAIKVLHGIGAMVCMQNEYKDVFSPIFCEFGEVHELLPDCDNIVVIGGDGTILKCAGIAVKYDKAILGINCGRLGFMATLEYDRLDELSALLNGKYSVSERMMLDAYISKNGVRTKLGTALNDIVLSKGVHCTIADFTIYRGNQAVSALRADGVIFSTPTGASAYSLSAGGPLIEPDISCIEVTQICPHSLFARSMIFSPDITLMAGCTASNGEKAVISIDGDYNFELDEVEKLYVRRSESVLKIISLENENFFNSINNKLMKPLKEEG